MGEARPERVTIYHIEGRRSFRVVCLCEELGIPYDLVFKPGDVLGSLIQLRMEYPLMPIAPTVRLRGELMVESGAILDVLRALRKRAADSTARIERLFEARAVDALRRGNGHEQDGDRSLRGACNRRRGQYVSGYRLGEPLDKPALVGSRGVFDYIEDYVSSGEFATSEVRVPGEIS